MFGWQLELSFVCHKTSIQLHLNCIGQAANFNFSLIFVFGGVSIICRLEGLRASSLCIEENDSNRVELIRRLATYLELSLTATIDDRNFADVRS